MKKQKSQTEKAEEKQKSKMDKLIVEAKRFIERYKKKIVQNLHENKRVVIVDFRDLETFSNTLAKEILNSPEETLQILEMALDDLGLIKNIRVRLTNIPELNAVRIEYLRTKHVDKLIIIEGYLVQASEVRPQTISSRFECPECRTIIDVLQIGKKFNEPTKCVCGRKKNFTLISKESIDAQRIIISESREMQETGEGLSFPKESAVSILLQGDLTDPSNEIIDRLGQKIKVTGILKEIPVLREEGGVSTRFDWAIIANNIIFKEPSKEILISKEDERQILKLSKDPKILERLAFSIAPSIWGYQEVKDALVLQLFGATRGNINTLIVGDPGV